MKRATLWQRGWEYASRRLGSGRRLDRNLAIWGDSERAPSYAAMEVRDGWVAGYKQAVKDAATPARADRTQAEKENAG